MAPWDNELSKFINDARYTSPSLPRLSHPRAANPPSHSRSNPPRPTRPLRRVLQGEDPRDARRQKSRRRSRRTQSRRTPSSPLSPTRPDLHSSQPLTAFRALLLTTVTSTRTHFSDFKRAHAKDPRYREFGKTEGEREKVFKGWLRELGERKRAEAQKAEERFAQMLREDAGIKAGDKWAEVRFFFGAFPSLESGAGS